MIPSEDAALDIARRIADGEAVDMSALEAHDPVLARRLAKLQALVGTMQGGAAAGTSWGHLQQLQLAGEGGFGAVYRAYDPTLDRTVALKLRHERSDSLLPSGRDFVAEARRLARVRHPGVLAVHGASYHDGRAGLWADWIDGETLSARLARSGALRSDEQLQVLLELADALAAVHRAGLAHGDIKASNVMLDAGGRVVLMDFGAGFDSSPEGTTISAGTPRYLAPEIVAGKSGTQAVDIYAYGVLANLLATTRFPERAQVDSSLRPRGLRALITEALDADPGARPSAEQLQVRLQHLIDAPRRRVRRWLLASVVVGLAGIALATAVGLRREHAERQRAERVSSFLASMYREQDPLSRAASDARSPDRLIADAVARVEAELSEDPESQAQLLRVMGEAQLNLSQLDDARTTLDRAVARLGADPLLRAEIDGLRGAVATRQLRSEDAQRYFDDARALATRTAGADSVVVGRIDALASFATMALGRYQDARTTAERAHRILGATLGADHPETIRALVALCIVLQAMRDDEAALARSREAIALIERRYGPDDARLVRPLAVQGAALFGRQRFDEARPVMIRGADIARRRIGPRSNSLANILVLRGDMERAAGDSTLALAVLGDAEQALAEGEMFGRAQLYSIRGSVLFERGDGPGAEADFRRALALRRSENGPQNATFWFLQAQVGDALALQKRFDEAHRLQAEAAEGLRAVVGADAYQNTLISTRRAGTYAMQRDWANSSVHHRESIRIIEATHGREHPNYFAWNLDLAHALSKLPQGGAEAAQIVDALIAAWADDPRVAKDHARLMLLRCELYLAAGDSTAARDLAAATLERPALVASAEQRDALAAFIAADRPLQ